LIVAFGFNLAPLFVDANFWRTTSTRSNKDDLVRLLFPLSGEGTPRVLTRTTNGGEVDCCIWFLNLALLVVYVKLRTTTITDGQ